MFRLLKSIIILALLFPALVTLTHAGVKQKLFFCTIMNEHVITKDSYELFVSVVKSETGNGKDDLYFVTKQPLITEEGTKLTEVALTDVAYYSSGKYLYFAADGGKNGVVFISQVFDYTVINVDIKDGNGSTIKTGLTNKFFCLESPTNWE